MVQKQARHPRRSDQEWLDIIHECRNSGMSDKAWCEAHQIYPSNFYYHIRRLRAKACDIPSTNSLAIQPTQEVIAIPMDSFCENQFSNQTSTQDVAIRLQAAGLQVEIFNSADSQTIYHTMAALQQL